MESAKMIENTFLAEYNIFDILPDDRLTKIYFECILSLWLHPRKNITLSVHFSQPIMRPILSQFCEFCLKIPKWR